MLRLELRGSNIYISLIEPGPIRSRFRDNYQAMEARLLKEGDAKAGGGETR